MAGARRWVWNWALARWKETFETTGKSISLKQLSAELTALKEKPETAWLKEADSQALQQVLKDLHRAFSNFFEKRARYPRFKSRKRDPLRFRIPQRVKIDDEKVYVPKVGQVRIRQSQPVEEKTKSATFRRSADGKWYVTLTVEFDMPDIPLPSPAPDERRRHRSWVEDIRHGHRLRTNPLPEVLSQGATEASQGSTSALQAEAWKQAEGQGQADRRPCPPEDRQPERRLPPQADDPACQRQRRHLHRGSVAQRSRENQAGQELHGCLDGRVPPSTDLQERVEPQAPGRDRSLLSFVPPVPWLWSSQQRVDALGSPLGVRLRDGA